MVRLANRIRRFDQRFYLHIDRSGVPQSFLDQTVLTLGKTWVSFSLFFGFPHIPVPVVDRLG